MTPDPGDHGERDSDRDEFEAIVAGLELSVPDELDEPADPGRSPDVFDPRMSDPVEPDAEDETEDFVPPEPEPFPPLDKASKAAWAVVIGSPLVLMAMSVLALTWPREVTGTLVLSFVAGVVYLLHRRGNHFRGDDPDQGAVL